MMTRMLSRWVSDKLRKGWNAWQSFVLLRDASLERERAQEARLRMVVQRIRLRGVSRAYLAWHEHVIQRKRLQRHVRHMLHRSKAAALSAWVDWVDTRQSLRRRMQLTLRKWTNENLRKGMQTWKNYILVVEAETERERVRSARLNNVICRIQNRCTSRAMIAWTNAVSERKRIRRFLRAHEAPASVFSLPGMDRACRDTTKAETPHACIPVARWKQCKLSSAMEERGSVTVGWACRSLRPGRLSWSASAR